MVNLINVMNMKNFLYNLLLGGTLTFGVASCMEVDNFDAPSECLTGSIIDVTTGQNILADQAEAVCVFGRRVTVSIPLHRIFR